MELTGKNRDNKFAEPMGVQHAEAEQEIDLIELFYRLLEKFKYIALSAALCTAIAAVYSFVVAVPMYEATAKLYVMSPSDSALNLSDLQMGTYLTSDYQEVFKAWEVHELVLRELGLGYTYDQLEGMLAISNPSNTRILNITVSSDDPQEATDMANTYAEVAKKYISDTMATDEPNILSVALRPVNPVSPNKSLNLMLGFLVGALLAVGIITVQFVMDDKIKTADDILRYVGLPNLALVPAMSEGKNRMKYPKDPPQSARPRQDTGSQSQWMPESGQQAQAKGWKQSKEAQRPQAGKQPQKEVSR